MSGGSPSGSGSGNNIWVPIIVALIGAAAVVLVGYWQYFHKNNTREFVGRVVESGSETRIRGAKITLEEQSAPPIMYTDSEGTFSFPIKSSSSAIRVRVEADGYEKFDRLITPSSKTGLEEIKLTPIELETNQIQIEPQNKLIPEGTSSNELKSSVGVNYTQLQHLLSEGSWKEADQETSQIFFQVANPQRTDWIDMIALDKFPCEDLQTIDHLWAKYSGARFGFGIQQAIWESVQDETLPPVAIRENFGQQVGWLDGPDFTINAPKGHLPVSWISLNWVGGLRRGGGILLDRAKKCGIQAVGFQRQY
ncbi:MAG: hypothetical protein F6K47_30585 [Symploca sp. SIO2E6]|nr:hypothetical protein [Symploca sp. SIO2E6]